MKSLIPVILTFLLICCKKDDLNLDLKYEVLNQLIAEEVAEDKESGYPEKYLYKISKPVDVKFGEQLVEKKDEISEPPPPRADGTIYLPQDGTFTKEDLAYLKIQLKTNSTFVLNIATITSKVEFIDPEKFLRFQKSQEKYGSARDYWIKFRNEFGDKCLRNYSTPLFNKDKTICIIIDSMSCGPLEGGGQTSIFKKINGKWNLIQTLDRWVS